MVTEASMGHQAKLGTAAEVTYGTAVTADQGFVFVNENIVKRGSIVERDGLRGTRSHVSTDTRAGVNSCGGTLVLEPTAADLAIWLPRILGAAAAGTTFGLAETVPSFTLVVDRIAKVFTYAGCKVSRAVISGSQGGLIRLAMDIVAQTEAVGAAGTFPSLTASVTAPFIFSDLVLTLAAAARECSSFELMIDNALAADRFQNSVNIINAPEGDRIVSLNTTHPYAAANTDLYGQALAGATGTLKLAQGAWAAAGDAGYGLIATFGVLQVPDNSPSVASRAEIPLNLGMTARKTGSTPELSIVLDSTA